ncbi:protein swallow-like [Drosophila obscura]|uniref:protein swallow-like n=1 Tax=Drosophila obscura TaxID=7282 RepID=UPI001BB227A9|nr:protein swallow-like [Drosophila obscura]
MSIMDESFPAELFDQVTNNGASTPRQIQELKRPTIFEHKDAHSPKSKAADRRKRFSHSAYTKQRYKHVTSKVAKYIAEMEAQDQTSRMAKENLRRNNSMPEYQTERCDVRERRHFSVDELNVVDQSVTNESYERLLCEIERQHKEIDRLQEENLRVQSYSDYLQGQLDEKAMQTLIMKRNFESIRIDLDICMQKLKRYENV